MQPGFNFQIDILNKNLFKSGRHLLCEALYQCWNFGLVYYLPIFLSFQLRPLFILNHKYNTKRKLQNFVNKNCCASFEEITGQFWELISSISYNLIFNYYILWSCSYKIFPCLYSDWQVFLVSKPCWIWYFGWFLIWKLSTIVRLVSDILIRRLIFGSSCLVALYMFMRNNRETATVQSVCHWKMGMHVTPDTLLSKLYIVGKEQLKCNI